MMSTRPLVQEEADDGQPQAVVARRQGWRLHQDLLGSERPAGWSRTPAGRLRSPLPGQGLGRRGGVLRQRRLRLRAQASTGLRADAGCRGVGQHRRHCHLAQRPLAPLTQGARGLHRSRRAQSSPPGRGHWRGLRPHDPGRPAVCAHRWGRGQKGVRGPQPPGAPQAPRARRARQARRPAGLGRAQRRRAGAGPRGRQPSADGPWPHDNCSRLERARRAGSV